MITPEELRRLQSEGWQLTSPIHRRDCVVCGRAYEAPHPLLCVDCYGEGCFEECPCPHEPGGLCMGNRECETEGQCRSCTRLPRRARREAERALKRAQRGRRPIA